MPDEVIPVPEENVGGRDAGIPVRPWFQEFVQAPRPIRMEPFGVRPGRLIAEFAVDGEGRFIEKDNPNHKRGEDLFQLILSGIREVYDVDATIAGGAVRDLAVGITKPKDVDVFLPMEWKEFTKGTNELGWASKPKKLPNKDYNQEECPFKSTARAEACVQGVNVDLVFIDKPLNVELVKQFPIHTQRVVWSLGTGMIKSPEAKEDIDNKRFTIDPSITNEEKIENLKNKINGWKKRSPVYKDWTVVVPEFKSWWEK